MSSLILIGDHSPSARALARLLAQATDGSVLSWTEDLIDGFWSTQPGLIAVHCLRRGTGAKEAAALVRDTPCPVAFAPPGYGERAPVALRRVGVAFDGWEESRIALAEGVALTEAAGAELVVLTVSDPDTASAVEVCGAEADLIGDVDVIERVLDGPVARALADACATEQLDLLVLGSPSHGPIHRVTLGSVSNELLHELPGCPLLVCPRGAAARRPTAVAAAVGAAGL